MIRISHRALGKCRFIFLVAITLGFLVFGGVSRACQICLPLPTESLADRILASEHLVLARENPNQPYTLQAVTILKAGPETPPPLGLFLDTSTKRRLSSNEDLTILCGWSPETREWRRLALHDDDLAPVVGAILAHGEQWRSDPAERVDYFAQYLTHESTLLSDLAHLEVARAPYAELLQYSDRIPRDQLLEKLANLRRMEWHALYILFLSQSENPEDRETIRNEIASTAQYGLKTQAAAWATAYLEIDGADALDQLRAWYGSERTRRPGERKAILAALAVHGDQERAPLRDPIIELLGEFLQTEPDLAPDIAAALSKWNRDELAGPIAALLQESPERFDTDATLLLRRYLREVEKRREVRSSESNGRKVVGPVLMVIGLLVLALLLGATGRLRGHPVPQS